MSEQVGTEATPAADARPEWMRRRERGNMFALRIMSKLSLLLGRRLSRLVVYGIALYFLLTAPAARRASRQYLGRCLGRPANYIDLYRHILSFASTIHDRVYLLNDRHDLFDVRVFGIESLHALHERSGGFFLFGAHLGSFEVMRTLARSMPNLKVCMAMYPENARRINSALSAINPRAMQDIIALGQLDAMLTVHRKLEEGAMVGILADRAAGADQYQGEDFFGVPARFPTGPFRMAAMLKHPVYFMAGLYRGGNRYDVHFELFADFAQTPPCERDAAIRTAISSYARVLERHCRSAPYNWFNFFDFWEPTQSDSA